MQEALRCVICDGEIEVKKSALIAPFLAWRIWSRTAFTVDLVCCRECEFQFYNPRLENQELEKLYKNYRLQDYWLMRKAFEPWYTKKLNAALAAPASYSKRRERLAGILSGFIKDRKIDKILDHGGDRGDLVAGLVPGAEAFVYDISGVVPVDGVQAIANPAECKPDLIINSNVLEHVGYPLLLAQEILECSTPGGLVYLEVPCEVPTGLYRITRRIAQIAMIAILRPRQLPSMLTSKAMYLMHEHINYFTEHSLSVLMNRAGGSIIASGFYEDTSLIGKAKIAWCLGCKK